MITDAEVQRIRDYAQAMQRWWDDPSTHASAAKAMLYASTAGHVLLSQNARSAALAQSILRTAHKETGIPLDVILNYAEMTVLLEKAGDLQAICEVFGNVILGGKP